MLDPAPARLVVDINGHQWHWLVRSIRRTRQFGRSALQVTGVGLAAELDEPYAAVRDHANATDATAVQLMDEALTINGVSIGWTIDASAITDWLVPAGAWRYAGTPAAAVRRIASAIGAAVQADPRLKVLRLQPRYPVLPWRWASDVTPDYALHDSVAARESVEWVDRPAYNTAWVSGSDHGILAHVTIDGTAGDSAAEMVTDALITASEAGRQRGMAILGDTGRKSIIQLSTPLEGDTTIPVIDVGSYVAYDGSVGIVRGTRIIADRPSVRQTIQIETQK